MRPHPPIERLLAITALAVATACGMDQAPMADSDPESNPSGTATCNVGGDGDGDGDGDALPNEEENGDPISCFSGSNAALNSASVLAAPTIALPYNESFDLASGENKCFKIVVNQPATLSVASDVWSGCSEDLDLVVIPQSNIEGETNRIYDVTIFGEIRPYLLDVGDYTLCAKQSGSERLEIGLSVALGEPVLHGDCAPDGEVFVAEHDEDLSLLENCASYGGWLLIAEEVTDLSALHNITKISFLDVRSRHLRSFEGLSSLSAIPDGLWVIGADNLESFAGTQLDRIGHQFDIFDNDALNSLGGLSNVVFESLERVRVTANDALPDLNGLDRLEAADGSVEINHNSELSSISGLKFLSHIGGHLQIHENGRLPCCEVEQLLVGLDEVAGLISVYGNFGTGTCEQATSAEPN